MVSASIDETASDSDGQRLSRPEPQNQQQQGNEGNELPSSKEERKKKLKLAKRRITEFVVLGAALGACIGATVVTHGIAAPIFGILVPIASWRQDRIQNDKEQMKQGCSGSSSERSN